MTHRQGDGQPWPQAQYPQQQYPPQGYGQQYPPQDEPWPPQQPQAQPWQQPGYGQQPPYPGQSQYAPPQPPPQRRKRHTVRNVLAGLGGLAAVIIAISVAASSGNHTVNTAGSGGTGGTGGGNTAAKQTARTGSAITLAGNSSGEQMSVTVTKVVSSAAENDGLSLAPAGDRLYAVQFRLKDTGSAAYSDAPSNGAAVVDSAGQSYQAGEETVTGCTSFPATENIAAGSSGLGCIVFEVPKSAKIVSVQFTLDSGMGPQTGQWSVG